MSEPFRPSNGTELISFTLYWCDDCARDAAFRDTNYDGDPALGCQILARGTAFAHEPDGPNYPKEWIVDEKGSRCTAHTTDPKCPIRCDQTKDMFA